MANQYSTEAEKNLIGCCLADRVACEDILAEIQAEDLYYEVHQIIFKTIKDLHDEGITVDLVSVTDRLEMSRPEADDMSYLIEVMKNLVTTAHYKEYMALVADKAKRRKLQSIMYQANEDINNGENTQNVVDRLSSELMRMRMAHDKKIISIADSTQGLLTYLESPDRIGVMSGYGEVDNYTGGWKPGELILVAGRPSMGKTAFALSMAVKMARNGSRTLVFECEMSDRDLTMRMASFVGNIPLVEIREKRIITSGDVDRMMDACETLSSYPITIVDSSGMTMSQVIARATAEKQRTGVDVIIIDYLQLLNGELGGNKSTNDIVGDMTKRLKQAARDLDAPVILLSQLNRGVDKRTEKRPILSDLRDSGAIEQDADIVAFLYRPSVYDDECDSAAAECIIAKNRNGPVGTAMIRWDGRTASYRDVV